MTDLSKLLKPDHGALSAEKALGSTVEVLEGVSPQAAELLRQLDIRDVFDLALARLFNNALHIAGNAGQAPDPLLRRFGRPARDMVDSGGETPAAALSVDAPLRLLEGVGPRNGPRIAKVFGVSTIRDLAGWAPFIAARTLLLAAYGDPQREQIEHLQNENQLLRDDATRAKAQAATALGDLQVHQQRLVDVEKRHAALQTERDQLQDRLADAEARLASGSTVPPPADDGALSVGSFATRLGGEIDSARVALKTRGFSLGTISVTSKALFEAGGTRIRLPERDELKSLPAGALSDIALQYTPSSEPASNDVLVPDVRQLTESAVRRVLASVGLSLDVSHGQPGMGVSSVEGQAMLQSPPPGERLARGSAVLVIFARSGI
jgi:hypothetical protein